MPQVTLVMNGSSPGEIYNCFIRPEKLGSGKRMRNSGGRDRKIYSFSLFLPLLSPSPFLSPSSLPSPFLSPSLSPYLPLPPLSLSSLPLLPLPPSPSLSLPPSPSLSLPLPPSPSPPSPSLSLPLSPSPSLSLPLPPSPSLSLPLPPSPSLSLPLPLPLSPSPLSLSSLSLPLPPSPSLSLSVFLSLFLHSFSPLHPPPPTLFHEQGLPYRPNISPLMVDISSETDNRLHIKIYDPNFKRWEVLTK